MRHFLVIPALFVAFPVIGGEPVVVDAGATRKGDVWHFAVTIAHGDTGWDHYADGWGVYLPDGTELGFRKLLHPHVEEQPFTRSLSGITIPDGVTEVIIRPHDSVDGWGKDFVVSLE